MNSSDNLATRLRHSDTPDGSSFYRELNPGEALQEGDEYWNPRRAEWRPYDSVPGLIVGCVYAPFKYRRPTARNVPANVL